MPYVELKLPSGLYKNGTEYQAKGRWFDSNLVRWDNNAMMPVKGWIQRGSALTTGKARGMIHWMENAGDRRLAVGTSSKLYVYTIDGTQSDITPVGFTSGYDDATISTGYGNYTYGSSAYGTERPESGIYTPATTWSLDNWGTYLVGCSNRDGKVYEWTGNPAVVAAVISTAPTSNQSLVVTEERSLMLIGAGGDKKKIQWSDLEDNTDWTPTATNQAGSFNITGYGELLSAIRVKGQILITSTVDAYTATYNGLPFVYSFERVGSNCGAVSTNSVVATETIAAWFGEGQFFVYDGVVRPLPSDVADFVFSDFNISQKSKVYGFNNSAFSEIWWFYPNNSSTENNRYVSWNYKENHWSVGEISRTCASDRGTFNNPLMIGGDRKLYEHETGYLYDGATVFAESAPYQIDQPSGRLMNVLQIIPDEKNLGDVSAKFKVRNYPTGSETTYPSSGSFTLANPTDVRFVAREVKFRVETARNADWRVGNMQIFVRTGGERG
jgi:hypothetical protein